MPWDGAQGRVDYTANIPETEKETRVAVALNVAAPVMPLPGFAYAVTDFTSAMSYSDGELTVTSIGGKLGGGGLAGSGKVGIGEGGVASMDLRLEGRDMVLSPMERMRAQADATLRILKDAKRFVTEGEILFKQLTWRREIYEAFGFSSQSEAAPSGPSFFDGMSLNIRLRADENAVIENALGRFAARFNLTATGALAEPVLLGDIDIVSGDFYFQDRTFRVLHGRLSFTDPVNTEPYLDFRGETYVKDFRVTLSMSGPVSRLKPEFASSPPLPPEEILSLLALGESFRRMYYSYAGDRSTALNTASLLTYQIADLAKKRTGGPALPGPLPDRPLYPGQRPRAASPPGSRSARSCPKNLLVLYSTILANSSVRADDRRSAHLPRGMGHQPEILARGRAGRPGKVWTRCQVPQALLDPIAGSAGPGRLLALALVLACGRRAGRRGPGRRGRRPHRRPRRRAAGGGGSPRPHPDPAGRRLLAAARRPGRQADLQHRPLRRRPGHEGGRGADRPRLRPRPERLHRRRPLQGTRRSPRRR